MRPAGGWMRCNLLDPISAWAQTEAAYAESLHPPDRVAQAFSAFTLGLVGLMLGRPVTALRWAGEAYLVAKETGKSALCRWAAAVRLQAAAQRGAEDEVAAAAVDLAHHRGGPHRVLLFEMEVARAWAWHAAVRADSAGVQTALGEEITRHGELGAVGAGALGALDLVRLGEPDLAVRLLTAFPPPRDWVLGRLIVGYATAAAAADAVALFVTAREFAGYDLPLHAAEAATQAARAWRAGGQPHRAARALLLAELHLARCEPAATPALRTAGPFAGLTDREREITLAAVRGESARAIAQRLYLAERTVENHLHRAYRKLAVTGRTELREVLGLD
jgi:DNA-binding CsgD family transcriptional regulator